VIKAIPPGINRRLSNISSSEAVFNSVKDTYQKALDDAGHSYQLHYEVPIHQNHRNRQRKITWYNPPFDRNVATNIGHKFLSIVTKCFPVTHPLHQICNRNTLKLSYCTMPNMQQLIQMDNRKKLGHQPDPITPPCNCRDKNNCPLNGGCRAKNVIYQAEVRSPTSTETYVGLTSNEFKTRLSNHKSTFRHEGKRLATELSKHVWDLKDQNKEFEIKWKILCRAKAYSNVSKRCNLCTAEKFFIICKP